MTDNPERKEKDSRCLLCGKDLEPSFIGDGCDYQPRGGGEVRFTFCFGSQKFDLCPGLTEYWGVVCDGCAANHVQFMEQRLYGMDGKLWTQEKQDEVDGKAQEFYQRNFGDGKGRTMEEAKNVLRAGQGTD